MEQEKTSLKDIFSLLRQGNKEGLELLYDLYYNKMYGIAFSIVKDEMKSEDIIHNVMYKLLKIDKSKFPIEYENTWLYSVIKNEALMTLRKENRIVNIDEIEEILATHDKTIEEYVAMDEFYSMIKSLNDEKKQIVTLKVLGDFTYKEIAEMLNKPVGTIQWLYNTSIKKLRFILASWISSIVLVFLAIFGESVIYWQNLSTQSTSSESKTNLYVDYTLIAILILFFALIILFIVFYKKFEKIPTKAHRKNI